MSESDERLDAVTEKIEDAKAAAAPLADRDVIDPDGDEPAEGDDPAD